MIASAANKRFAAAPVLAVPAAESRPGSERGREA